MDKRSDNFYPGSNAAHILLHQNQVFWLSMFIQGIQLSNVHTANTVTYKTR